MKWRASPENRVCSLLIRPLSSVLCLQFFDLSHFQLDPRGTAENRDRDLQA
jgi:hypothetical protein